MASYVDIIKDAADTLLVAFEETLDAAERVAPGIIDDATRRMFFPPLYPNSWPNPIGDALTASVLASIGLTRESVEIARGMLTWLGSPDALRTAATALLDDVKGPVDGLEPIVIMDQLQAMRTTNWNDPPASEDYRLGFDGQNTAMMKISDTAAALAESLKSMADAIEKFYLEAYVALNALTIAVIGAIAGIIGGSPGGPVGMAVGGVLAALAGFAAAALSLVDLIMTLCEDRTTEIENVGDLTWPVPTFCS